MVRARWSANLGFDDSMMLVRFADISADQLADNIYKIIYALELFRAPNAGPNDFPVPGLTAKRALKPSQRSHGEFYVTSTGCFSP